MITVGHRALGALVLMALKGLLGQDIGSDHYVSASSHVGSRIGDHGIGKM